MARDAIEICQANYNNKVMKFILFTGKYLRALAALISMIYGGIYIYKYMYIYVITWEFK